MIFFNSGKKGEALSAKYLIKKGYTIIERNKVVSGVEFDIIAVKDETLHFIEVKTRKNIEHGRPEEFVDLKKRKRLIRGAKSYWSNSKKYFNYYMSFDIISVILETKEIEHFISVIYEDN